MHLHALWVEKAEFVVALGGAHSDHWAERMKLALISTDIYTAYKQHGNIYMYIYIYTGCNRRNVPDFGRVFLMLNYTDITQNTYIQS